MRVTVRRGFWSRNTICWVPGSGQGPSAVLLWGRPPVVCTADTWVSRARRVEPLYLFNGKPDWRGRFQRNLPNWLLEATPRSRTMWGHGLRTLASPAQPRGIVKKARLAGLTMHFQGTPIPYGKMQFPGWAVPIESGRLGERSGAVSGQGVGRRASWVTERAGS